MAAVKYEKSAFSHTRGLAVLSTPSGPFFQYTNFRPILIGRPYVLKLSIVSTDSMDIGTKVYSRWKPPITMLASPIVIRGEGGLSDRHSNHRGCGDLIHDVLVELPLAQHVGCFPVDVF